MVGNVDLVLAQSMARATASAGVRAHGGGGA